MVKQIKDRHTGLRSHSHGRELYHDKTTIPEQTGQYDHSPNTHTHRDLCMCWLSFSPVNGNWEMENISHEAYVHLFHILMKLRFLFTSIAQINPDNLNRIPTRTVKRINFTKHLLTKFYDAFRGNYITANIFDSTTPPLKWGTRLKKGGKNLDKWSDRFIYIHSYFNEKNSLCNPSRHLDRN